MRIFSRSNRGVDIQLMREELKRTNGELERANLAIGNLKQIQEMLGQKILNYTEWENEYSREYAGNKYRAYTAAIEEIDAKYNGTSKWGVLQTGNIIDLRASFIISQGIKYKAKTDPEDAANELAFIDAFLRYNDLDKEIAQEFAKEAEIEGRILLRLSADDEPFEDFPMMINVRFVSWLAKKYVIMPSPDDYLDYQSVSWADKAGQPVRMEKPFFVYKKFGGRTSDPNVAVPKIMKCLTQIENLDMALRDWREINRLFAAPVPIFECQTPEEVKKVEEVLDMQGKTFNWKIRKAFVLQGKFYFAGPDMAGVQSLENEIVTNAKMISGTSGVPVHFLGLPDLMSNRSTAENLMELIYASTLKERETWKGAYEELITKAMILYNAVALAQKSAKLDPTKVSIEIPYPSDEQWRRIIDVFLPLSIAGKISDETLLAQIPGIDIQAEKQSAEERSASELERVKSELATERENKLNEEVLNA